MRSRIQITYLSLLLSVILAGCGFIGDFAVYRSSEGGGRRTFSIEEPGSSVKMMVRGCGVFLSEIMLIDL